MLEKINVLATVAFFVTCCVSLFWTMAGKIMFKDQWWVAVIGCICIVIMAVRQYVRDERGTLYWSFAALASAIIYWLATGFTGDDAFKVMAAVALFLYMPFYGFMLYLGYAVDRGADIEELLK